MIDVSCVRLFLILYCEICLQHGLWLCPCSNLFSCRFITADQTPANALMSLQHQLCSNREVNVDRLCPVYMSAERSWREQLWQEQDQKLTLMLLGHEWRSCCGWKVHALKGFKCPADCRAAADLNFTCLGFAVYHSLSKFLILIKAKELIITTIKIITIIIINWVNCVKHHFQFLVIYLLW